MIEIDHDVAAHRFTTTVDGERAVLDYTLAADVMTITHTEVPNYGFPVSLMEMDLFIADSSGKVLVNGYVDRADLEESRACDLTGDLPKLSHSDMRLGLWGSPVLCMRPLHTRLIEILLLSPSSSVSTTRVALLGTK